MARLIDEGERCAEPLVLPTALTDRVPGWDDLDAGNNNGNYNDESGSGGIAGGLRSLRLSSVATSLSGSVCAAWNALPPVLPINTPESTSAPPPSPSWGAWIRGGTAIGDGDGDGGGGVPGAASGLDYVS